MASTWSRPQCVKFQFIVFSITTCLSGFGSIILKWEVWLSHHIHCPGFCKLKCWSGSHTQSHIVRIDLHPFDSFIHFNWPVSIHTVKPKLLTKDGLGAMSYVVHYLQHGSMDTFAAAREMGDHLQIYLLFSSGTVTLCHLNLQSLTEWQPHLHFARYSWSQTSKEFQLEPPWVLTQ